MKTTVMFVADSEPISGAPVRLAGSASDVFVTDAEGKIEVGLDLGTHTFEVQVGDEWVERTVQRQGHAPLFVVNIRQPAQRELNTLDTLQIDLSSLVGDRYVFETVLGRGGMGVVVKAVDRMLNRPVAIKMLSDELQDNEEAQQIFLVEARNLATLSHPNLVAIHDILNVGGRVLMVFEYVLGENVETTIKARGRLDQKEVLKIAIQLTRCVSYLHEHDLIHRDLKPANIIMQADGTLKLIDFGLARSLNELYIRGTRVRGTPAYMAPEQIQGIHLTTATDIYQIGISMYEMLTSKLPFSTGDMAYAHVHLEPPPITDHVADIDPELAELVHSCLAKQPRKRPESAEYLLERLQAIYARLANRDSQPMGLLDPTSGSFAEVEELTVTKPPEVVSVEELSFVAEVSGGTNRGLLVLGLVGLCALAAAAFVVFHRRPAAPTEIAAVSQTNTATAATTATNAVDKPAPTTVAQERPQPVDDSHDSVIAARGLIHLGIATASGRSSGAAVAVEDQARQAVGSTTLHVQAAQHPKPHHHHHRIAKRRPHSTPTRPASTETKPKKTAHANGVAPGLLSVDGPAAKKDDSAKTLLPVSE